MDDFDFNQKSFKQEDIDNIKHVIQDGCQVLQKIEDLKMGLSESVKAVASKIEVRPAQLNRAIRMARKATLDAERAKLDEIEDLLEAAGKK